jgi:hypothetical protein
MLAFTSVMELSGLCRLLGSKFGPTGPGASYQPLVPRAALGLLRLWLQEGTPCSAQP